ncbi:MAG: histidinol-phosphatase [Candidatus Lindowbacteria bacterium RIFCSPLOWO2_12_FULL_62_27]|nr:MAG: histidinol-phosphatase [Candidatus Lindowbacteria bacterium RIFCSPLOWO2_02_FULL_62_12]OGH62573.1 MAG: histidinol-phosphatase [Candidatus Lindowbacteria bacterium RIFCSPLOWO2_12_FULL_62_27]
MENPQVSELLSEIGVVLELLGENTFKVRAYENAARAVDAYTGRIAELDEKQLQEISGIGKGLAEKIHMYCSIGYLPYYEDLKKKIPRGLVEMLRIPSLGPKRAKLLFDKLKIDSVAALETACAEGRLAALEGFGEKSQAKIMEGIRMLSTFRDQHLLAEVLPLAERLVAHLKKCKAVRRIEIAGSIRRRKKLVKDLDIVVSSDRPGDVSEAFVGADGVTEVIARGDTKTSVRLADKIQADLRVVADDEFPYALHHFTGSKAHNIALRSLAKDRGLKISEYGVFKGKKRIAAKDEESFFKIFGLAFIPPELREDRGEIAAAAEGGLPDLVTDRDIKGILHVHTNWSDGMADLEVMVKEAARRGYQYIAITDHSQTSYYAKGLPVERLKKQMAEIAAINKKRPGIRVLAGSEVDILPDGRLDYDDDLLASLDVVIAAVHSHFGMKPDEMTKRICRALEHPEVDILAHPTGRLLLTRPGYEFDWEAALKCAARHGKSVELNANPQRLDIDPVHAKRAAQLGVKISINPDAHRVEGLDDMRYGVWAARRGWLGRKDIINTENW